MGRKRTSHKPIERQDWIYNHLVENGNLGFNEVFSIYTEKFSLSEQTFAKDWVLSSDRYKGYVNRVNKARDAARVSAEVDIALKELKSKHDRLMEYQKLVDECLRDLATGMTDDVNLYDGKITEYRRKMSITEVNQTRRTLRDLQVEISKMEGDYADTKINHDVKMLPIFKLDE